MTPPALHGEGGNNNENTGGDAATGETSLADTLIASADIGVVIAFGLALLYLMVGLVRPSWAWATKRRSVVLRSLGLMLLSLVGFAGVIGYSLTLPDSPHSIDRYLKDYDFEQLKKPAPDNGQQ